MWFTFYIDRGQLVNPLEAERGTTPWSFHLADCFWPIPALHFAETFAALPA